MPWIRNHLRRPIAVMATALATLALVTFSGTRGTQPGSRLAWPAPAAAQGTQGTWLLYGHDNASSSILAIDTTTGLARTVGLTGVASGASGMATARDTVPGPGGASYPAGTHFGLLTDGGRFADYVFAVDTTTGAVKDVVRTSRDIGGRGVAFGPDGKTFFVIESDGMLSTIDTVTGDVDGVGLAMTAGGIRTSSDNLEWDPDSGQFVILAGGNPRTLYYVDPATARASRIGRLDGVDACTIARAPGPVAGPNGTTLPAGTWFTVNRGGGGRLITFSFNAVAGAARIDLDIGRLHPLFSTTSVCGTAFAEPRRLPTPEPTPPPPPVADCVCGDVRARVPRIVIDRILADPPRTYGWRWPLNPNLPPGPHNPLRTCLALTNPNIAYHPTFNQPVWKAGCLWR